MEGLGAQCSLDHADLLADSPAAQLSNSAGSSFNGSLDGNGRKKISADPQISVSHLSEESTMSESDEEKIEEVSENYPYKKTPKAQKRKQEEEEMKDHVSCCLKPSNENVKVEPTQETHTRNVEYTTQESRVDMRHLQEVMSLIIHKKIGDKENRSQGCQDSLAFKDLLNELFNTDALHPPTRHDLTVAVAFFALVTLATEEGLYLEQGIDIHDVIIRIDSRTGEEVRHRNM